jgi:hypothetical protein
MHDPSLDRRSLLSTSITTVKIRATRSGIVTQIDAKLVVFNELLICSRSDEDSFTKASGIENQRFGLSEECSHPTLR